MSRAPRKPKAEAEPKTPAKRGPKPHEPTAESRLTVIVALLQGRTHAEVAAMLEPKISGASLRNHYRAEIDLAALGEERALTNAMLKRALDPRHPQGTDAAKFILARRHKWSEIQKHEHGGRDGKPIEHRDLSGYSDEELEALERARAILDGDSPSGAADPVDPQPRGDPGGEAPAFV